jgi:hypothetical protein
VMLKVVVHPHNHGRSHTQQAISVGSFGVRARTAI